MTRRLRLIKGWKDLPAEDRGAALAMGNFDGVHRGHQSIIADAVAQAAELGVRRIRPILTERVSAPPANVARLLAIAIEAAEQCGRLDVPEVATPVRLDTLFAAWPAERRLMFCDEGGEAATAMEALRGLPAGPWSVLIGPEGGFSPGEREAIRARGEVTAVSLGPRILRADTAAISALTLWQSALGDWRGA